MNYQKALITAKRKGLAVTKNQFTVGWCIKLPNGSIYHSPSDSDMICYVKDY